MLREIIPATQVSATLLLPGSKYIANRMLPLCALAESQSRLTNLVNNDDINTAVAGLSNLGYQFERDSVNSLIVDPRTRTLDAPAELHTAHSGTFSRFVAAIAALEEVPVKINCSKKMATRPMDELFASLRSLNVGIESPNDCLPAIINGPVNGSRCELDASRSSQYLSALLIIAPRLKDGLRVTVTEKLVSSAYVRMTIALMAKLGVSVKREENQFIVEAGQSYHGVDFAIPGDPVSATYFMGLAAISGGDITIRNFDFSSVQGEAGFYRVLQKMGVVCERKDNDLKVIGSSQLKAIDIDMGEMPDAVQTLAAVACYARGTTHISNIAHLAYKESNRIEDTAKEIRKTGIRVDTGTDFMTIYGCEAIEGVQSAGCLNPAELDTHEDHRMAMSLALLGVKSPGIKIRDPKVVEKSFPTYWDFLSRAGLDSRRL